MLYSKKNLKKYKGGTSNMPKKRPLFKPHKGERLLCSPTDIMTYADRKDLPTFYKTYLSGINADKNRTTLHALDLCCWLEKKKLTKQDIVLLAEMTNGIKEEIRRKI